MVAAMATEVTYHRDGYGPGKPAINVKDRHPGIRYTMPDLDTGLGVGRAEEIIETAYQQVVGRFWHDAAALAVELGLGEIEQQGRSGGWLVISQGDPDELAGHDRREWLAAYRVLREWAESYIADAPEKVTTLARDMAIEQVSASAVHRMFDQERTLTEFRAARAENENASHYYRPV